MLLNKRGSVRRRTGGGLVLTIVTFAVCAGGAPAADGPDPRIVGGKETTTEEWPWQAAIERTGSFACGGSLIGADLVLTAAHCVQDAAGTPTPAADLIARFNLTDLSDAGDPDAFAVAVQETYIAPRFDLSQLAEGFDFALLRLETQLDQATIELATSGDARRFEVGRKASAVGWGLLAGDPPTGTSVLHEVDVRLADCSSDVGFSDALFFCATGTDGTCFGDSGGPLMIERKDGTFRQIGISSFSDPACAHFHVWTNIAIGPVRSAVEDAIEALDGDGSAGEASDAAAPDTRITKAPGNKVRARHKRVRVSIRFTANEASDFTCALDGKAAHRCGSPQRLRVKKGRHRFKVFATDSAGNDDPTPARATWRVKRVD